MSKAAGGTFLLSGVMPNEYGRQQQQQQDERHHAQLQKLQSATPRPAVSFKFVLQSLPDLFGRLFVELGLVFLEKIKNVGHGFCSA